MVETFCSTYNHKSINTSLTILGFVKTVSSRFFHFLYCKFCKAANIVFMWVTGKDWPCCVRTRGETKTTAVGSEPSRGQNQHNQTGLWRSSPRHFLNFHFLHQYCIHDRKNNHKLFRKKYFLKSTKNLEGQDSW